MDEQSLENTGKGGQNAEVLIESKRSTEDIHPLHLSPNPRNQTDFFGDCAHSSLLLEVATSQTPYFPHLTTVFFDSCRNLLVGDLGAPPTV